MALSQLCTELNSTLCVLKKFAPSESHVCCGGAGPHVGVQESSGTIDVQEDTSEPFSADCCQEGCCKVCNSPPFLTTKNASMIVPPASSALAEMKILCMLSDFSVSVFKPPQS
jgi:hypothetical protein